MVYKSDINNFVPFKNNYRVVVDSLFKKKPKELIKKTSRTHPS